MGVYVANIEQKDDGRWEAAADGLVATGDGYTAARDALSDALFARDGQEPTIRRDRTEVAIPGRQERTPDRLTALIAAEVPDHVEKAARSLAEARERDAREESTSAVTAWCVHTAGIIVISRACPTENRGEPSFVPGTKPDPRAGGDVFLACWMPHELDDLDELKKVADVPRTVMGIVEALDPYLRAQAWQDMTRATHGPALDRAMARWWHAAMVMGTAATERTVRQANQRLAAGQHGTPMTDLPASRARDDLYRDLTDAEKAADRHERDRQQQQDETTRCAREDAYLDDIERLLAADRQRFDAQRQNERQRLTVLAARSGIDGPEREYPIGTALFTLLRDGRPITMHLPARPWRRVTSREPGEPYHFLFTSEDGAQLAHVTHVRTYDSVEAFDRAGEETTTADVVAPSRQELASYPASWGGIVTLTVAPDGEPVLHDTVAPPPSAAAESGAEEQQARAVAAAREIGIDYTGELRQAGEAIWAKIRAQATRPDVLEELDGLQLDALDERNGGTTA